LSQWLACFRVEPRAESLHQKRQSVPLPPPIDRFYLHAQRGEKFRSKDNQKTSLPNPISVASRTSLFLSSPWPPATTTTTTGLSTFISTNPDLHRRRISHRDYHHHQPLQISLFISVFPFHSLVCKTCTMHVSAMPGKIITWVGSYGIVTSPGWIISPVHAARLSPTQYKVVCILFGLVPNQFCFGSGPFKNLQKKYIFKKIHDFLAYFSIHFN